MKQITFAESWESFFEAQNVRSFDDFFNRDQGCTVNENTKRNVLKMPLGGRLFFMKRFFRPHFKDMLFTVRNFGRFCSQAELEWRNANLLLENGIETYRPVCFGAETLCGIERRSFFVTEAINGTCLVDFLLDEWPALTGAERQALVVKLAQFFRRIHSARLSLPDAYIWHVYLIRRGTTLLDFEFGMIDLHRMQIKTRGHREAARNLAAFLFSLPAEYVDTSLRDLFLQSYFETSSISGKDDFLSVLRQREQILQSRRTVPPLHQLKTPV